MQKTAAHRAAIAEGQRRAWRTKRARRPLGATHGDHYGYRRVKVVEESGPWRLEHVVVMEQALGRKLERGEIVHHINGDRSDNRPENLFLCGDRAHHNEIHRSLDAVLRTLIAAGVVVFREGRYEAVLRPD